MAKKKVWKKKNVPGQWKMRQSTTFVSLERADKDSKKTYEYESWQAAKQAGWRSK